MTMAHDAGPLAWRGFALISRCADLVGHIHEERQKPALCAIWQAADQAVPYDGEAGG